MDEIDIDRLFNEKRAALFLDFDGTLVDFAVTPESVYVSDDLKYLLLELLNCLDGAMAVVSGRTISSLDQVLSLAEIPLSGIHGFEWRIRGQYFVDERSSKNFELSKVVLRRFADRCGCFFEDKDKAFALHFRGRPYLEKIIDDFLQTEIAPLADIKLIYGNEVREIHPLGINKGFAVERFMKMSPFKNRIPIYIGDDSTDEDAFHWVNLNGGFSFKVREGATVAKYKLEDVIAVHQLLRKIKCYK